MAADSDGIAVMGLEGGQVGGQAGKPLRQAGDGFGQLAQAAAGQVLLL
jgi:hypothetical protein